MKIEILSDNKTHNNSNRASFQIYCPSTYENSYTYQRRLKTIQVDPYSNYDVTLIKLNLTNTASFRSYCFNSYESVNTSHRHLKKFKSIETIYDVTRKT